VILSYKYRIEPTKRQADLLSEMLRDFCSLYNAALQERIDAFKHAAAIPSVSKHRKKRQRFR
jgi:putative transposase